MSEILRSPVILLILLVTIVAGIVFFVDGKIPVLVIAFGNGALKAGPALWRRLFWKKTEGEVIELCQGRATEFSSVTYRYHVDGAEYQGSANENSKWHNKWQKIQVDYKPDQPAVSRYTSDFSEFVIGWGFIMVGVILLLTLN